MEKIRTAKKRSNKVDERICEDMKNRLAGELRGRIMVESWAILFQRYNRQQERQLVMSSWSATSQSMSIKSDTPFGEDIVTHTM